MPAPQGCAAAAVTRLCHPVIAAAVSPLCPHRVPACHPLTAPLAPPPAPPRARPGSRPAAAMAEPGGGRPVTVSDVQQLVRRKDEIEAQIKACYELLEGVSARAGPAGPGGAVRARPPPNRRLSPHSKRASGCTSRWWTPRASPARTSTCTKCAPPGTTSSVSGEREPGGGALPGAGPRPMPRDEPAKPGCAGQTRPLPGNGHRGALWNPHGARCNSAEPGPGAALSLFPWFCSGLGAAARAESVKCFWTRVAAAALKFCHCCGAIWDL